MVSQVIVRRLPVPERAVLLDSSKCPLRGSPSRFLLPVRILVPDSTLGGDPPPLKLGPDSLGVPPSPGGTPGLGDCLSWTLCLLLFRSTKKAKSEADSATRATPAAAMPAIAPVPMPAVALEACPSWLKGSPGMLGDAPGAGAGAGAAGGGGAGKRPWPVAGDNNGPSAALAAICSADSGELAEGKEELAGVATRVGAGVATGA